MERFKEGAFYKDKDKKLFKKKNEEENRIQLRGFEGWDEKWWLWLWVLKIKKMYVIKS